MGRFARSFFLLFSTACSLHCIIAAAADANSPELTDAQGSEPGHEGAQQLKARTAKFVKTNSLARFIGPRFLLTLQQSIIANGKCRPRVCFALDGSTSQTERNWDTQKLLTELVAWLLGVSGGAELSAVQYGLSSVLVAGATTNLSNFLWHVDDAKFDRANETFVGAALGFCIRAVRGRGRALEDGSIVILGDARVTFGESFLPVVVGEVKSERVFSVLIGYPRNREKAVEISGSESRVFGVGTQADREYGNAGGVIASLVQEICELD